MGRGYIRFKRICDLMISIIGLVILSPLFFIIIIAIKLDSKGPVFFLQKRVGIHKRYFRIIKFRTMKISTPKNMPTHMLANPKQYITRVGKVLRKTSLDELPQIINIIKGDMSIVGPRPALWNQYDLIKERDKYGANDVLPGLTGWAQINGRDELEISEKAKLDGEYIKKIGVFMDIKCFVGTIISVLKSDGIVEGKAGENLRDNVIQEEYGYKKKYNIDKNESHKKVLITGAGSYIGESFKQYVQEHYNQNLMIDTIDMTDGEWKKYDFTSYDSVFHVSGIAHSDVESIDKDMIKKYYSVNTDLAIETAKKAKGSGVSQFVFMSSMIIYGDVSSYGKKRIINEYTEPSPSNFYGDSKWQADKGIRELASEEFRVAILRPPMVYGKGSKGNYSLLAKIAKIAPLFPKVNSLRSMIYIENLCEFLSQIIMCGEGGIFFPQNEEYVKVHEMVEMINSVANGNICITRMINPLVYLGSKIPGRISKLVNKAFGYSIYDQEISTYDGLDYQVKNLKESIEATETKIAESKAVLFLVNHDIVIYNFRLELVERLLNDGYEVHVSSPYGERIDDLIALGVKYHKINIDRHGMNPIKEYHLLKAYKKLITDIQPLIVLGYTIKPNIYGAIAAKKAHIPFVANITGLGTAVENSGLSQKLTLQLYKYAFKDVQTVFFQNKENEQFFKKRKIAVGKHKLLPGSGVNLKRYPISDYPECSNGKNNIPIRFAFISRIMKEKGIEQYLLAAEKLKRKYPAVEFHVCGFCETEYKGKLEEMAKKGIVIYHGMVRDVSGFLKDIHCVVHPTYYPEGISNVLLEASSSGRPIITTNRAGCREVVDEGVNGYLVLEKDIKSLVAAMERFIKLDFKKKKAMGMEARKIVEKKFDRHIVIEAYMKEIEICHL